MVDSQKFIVMGRFGKAHGLKGWLRINSETQPKENILNYQPWLVESKGKYNTLKITGSMMHGETLLVHIEDIDTPDDAKALIGSFIHIERSQLPDLSKNEYYWADLQGLQVFNIDDESLGYVDHLIEAGACDVMVVKGDKEYLIPFDRKNVITCINIDEGKIIVNWNEPF